MSWRKGRPRKLPDPRKVKFARLVATGKGKVASMVEAGLEERGPMGGPLIRNADKLLRDPEVVEELVRKVRSYARGWVEIEELCRGVLTNQMLGIAADGRELVMSDTELAGLQQRTALGALAILSRHAPEALVGRAVAEDQAARSLEEIARDIVGRPALAETNPQEPSLAPGPDDEEVH